MSSVPLYCLVLSARRLSRHVFTNCLYKHYRFTHVTCQITSKLYITSNIAYYIFYTLHVVATTTYKLLTQQYLKENYWSQIQNIELYTFSSPLFLLFLLTCNCSYWQYIYLEPLSNYNGLRTALKHYSSLHYANHYPPHLSALCLYISCPLLSISVAHYIHFPAKMSSSISIYYVTFQCFITVLWLFVRFTFTHFSFTNSFTHLNIVNVPYLWWTAEVWNETWNNNVFIPLSIIFIILFHFVNIYRV